MNFVKRNKNLLIVFLFFVGLGFVFLNRAFLRNETALPGDVLIGHYYPWRDYVWDGRESGYPIKNFDLNDAVVQFFPWRKFTTQQLASGIIPFRNPYNFLGTPHLANIATAVFYPPTLLFYIMPLFSAWDVFVALQIIFASFFMYLYLQNLKVDKLAAIYGGVVFCLSSLLITTLEFTVIGHTVMWAPLILFSIDRLQASKKTRYLVLGVIAIFCSLLAGFIQMSIYIYILSFAYFIFRAKRQDYKYLGIMIFPLLFAMFQLLPFAEVATGSSRIAGYFSGFSDARKYLMPTNRLVGGLIPDYFGSPATGNFFGGISYTEFAFYMGVPVVIFVIYKLTSKQKDPLTRFWMVVLITSMVLMTVNPLSKLIHTLNIPVYSSLLPSRLVSIVTICLAVLSSLGISAFQKDLKSKSNISRLTKIIAGIFLIFIYYIVDAVALSRLEPEHGQVALRNSVIPFLIFMFVSLSLFWAKINFKTWLYFIIFITILDLTRQGLKYNTFIAENLVFPNTKSLELISNQKVPPRVVMTHQEHFPAEANVYYGFSLLGGYDSVHSAKTEKLLNTLNYEDVNPERVSGRVVFVSSLTSRAYDVLSPDYYFVLSENEYPIKNMELLLSEGRNKVYKNLSAYPRVYLTKNVEKVEPNDILPKVLAMAENHEKKAYVDQDIVLSKGEVDGSVELTEDKTNELLISVNTKTDSVVVLNEAYDKNWSAQISGKKVDLFETNYNLIGFVAPPGEYEVKLSYYPKSFEMGLKISVISFLVFMGYLASFRSFRLRPQPQ